jgi:hypothetical protein
MRVDAERAERIFFVAAMRSVPDEMSWSVADALNNLRAPLDYLALRLETEALGSEPRGHTYFPIAGTFDEYVVARDRNLPSVGADARKAIDGLEPYKDGAGHALWQLNQLNNREKHQRPLVVMGAFAKYDVWAGMRDTWKASAPDWLDVDAIPDMAIWIAPRDRLCPLEAGDELYRESLDIKAVSPRQFAFELALNEPAVVECAEVNKVMGEIYKYVEHAVAVIEPFLST